jgi:uncharacterized protein (DUF1499 family)
MKTKARFFATTAEVFLVDDTQKARLAQNEDFFREVNARINEKAESHGLDSHKYEFFCECSDARCMERVKLTVEEYEHIRAEPTRFVVRNNHVIREIEHVVESVPDHMVIEKHGEAGRVAVQLEAESSDD